MPAIVSSYVVAWALLPKRLKENPMKTILSLLLFAAPALAGGIKTDIPAKIRSEVRAATDLKGKVTLNGAYQPGGIPYGGTKPIQGSWNISVNQGRGAGSKTQGFVVSSSGKIIDKTPVAVQPAGDL
jgi:hypothetical protein